MSMHDRLNHCFTEVITRFNGCEGMQRFWRGELDRMHYAHLMREVFHHARENPQIQAAATAYFRGTQRESVRGFLRHAVSEIGHDQLALADAQAAGLDVSQAPEQFALPATTALVAFAYYQIYHHDVVGYLGYLYFLEFMPTGFGAEYMQRLGDMGIGPQAMTFLQDHATIDVGHNKLMNGYIEALVTDEQKLQTVMYAMRVTGHLYSGMVTEAFLDADRYLAGRNELPEVTYAAR